MTMMDIRIDLFPLLHDYERIDMTLSEWHTSLRYVLGNFSSVVLAVREGEQ
jgi:hypothetical protein